MSDRLVKVASCANELEASNLAAYLNENGIKATVEAGVVNTLLNYGPALGGVKILTAAEDEETALALLSKMHDHSDDATANWHCPECSKVVAADFDTCWNCSSPRPESYDSNNEAKD